MARNRSNTRGTAHTYPRGILSVSRGGYGFVKTAEGEFFIPAAKMNGAFDGDLVEISPARQERSRKALARAASGTRKREARVKRIIEHAHAELVGRYEVAEPFGVVVPEDPRIPYDVFTLRSESPDIPDGAIVRVAITTYPSHKEAATGTVVEMLGNDDDERVPIDLIVARHKLQTKFSEAALREAGEARVGEEEALAEGYRDLRDRFVFTVDPADARDFDDAVSLEPLGEWAGSGSGGSGSCAQKLDPLYSENLVDDRRSLRSAARPPGAGASGDPGDGVQKLDPLSNNNLADDRRSLHSAISPTPSAASGDPGKRAQKLDPLYSENLVDDRRSLRSDISPTPSGASGDADARASGWGGGQYWRLGVHIADVSYYVPWACSVDLEARSRATSVYLVDRVLPMLPERLSNDVCSLRPGEVRRSMTVDMVVNPRGEVVKVEAYPALIRSNARLTYDQAQACIDGDESLGPDLTRRIRRLSQIAKQRMALREAAGGLDFETVEAKVRLDAEGAPVEIVVRERTDATQLIEEAMIATNEAVARHLHSIGYPCVYRVHDKPSRENLSGLVPVLQEFPWFKDVDVERFVSGNPHEVGKVLRACAGRAEAPLVTTLVLRSMKRAIYEPELGVHYALASAAYAHFTSPIRRYPDLVVHRMLRASLFGRPQKFDQEVTNLASIAEHSSAMERIADQADRESQEAKIVELMEAHVGETFSAMISGVATYGLFVRLDNTAEGMVDVADMGNEYFSLDPVRHTLTGSDTGKQYRLGKHIAVRLVEADRRTRHLRFKLVRS